MCSSKDYDEEDVGDGAAVRKERREEKRREEKENQLFLYLLGR
jgi:hypothetical protein